MRFAAALLAAAAAADLNASSVDEVFGSVREVSYRD